jgi:hypothetical protein
MDHHRTRAKVLARIPDLGTPGTAGKTSIHGEDAGSLVSMGRLLSQRMSFKLLAGTAVALMAAAIVPFLLTSKKTAVDSSPANDLTPWQANASGTDRNSPISQPKATLVRAMPEKSQGPGAPALQPPATRGVPPSPHDDMPVMSSWPNPAFAGAPHVGNGEAEPTPGANRPMSVPPPEYQADSRNGERSTRLGPAPSEGPTEKSANRNSYESTRPSVH